MEGDFPLVFHGQGAPEKRMRVSGFWQSWLLPLILVLTLVGVSRGLGAEICPPEPGLGSAPEAPALPPPKAPPAAAPLTPAAGQTDFTLHSFHIVGAKTEKVKD